MVSYDYYRNTYLGTQLQEQEFAPLICRAREVLTRFCRDYCVVGGEDAKAMAICAMAEVLHQNAGRRGVASASVGGVSVRYLEDGDRSLTRELLRKAAIYLDIYRGRWAD